MKNAGIDYSTHRGPIDHLLTKAPNDEKIRKYEEGKNERMTAPSIP